MLSREGGIPVNENVAFRPNALYSAYSWCFEVEECPMRKTLLLVPAVSCLSVFGMEMKLTEDQVRSDCTRVVVYLQSFLEGSLHFKEMGGEVKDKIHQLNAIINLQWRENMQNYNSSQIETLKSGVNSVPMIEQSPSSVESSKSEEEDEDYTLEQLEELLYSSLYRIFQNPDNNSWQAHIENMVRCMLERPECDRDNLASIIKILKEKESTQQLYDTLTKLIN